MSTPALDQALKEKRYGTLDENGNILNIDNYWRMLNDPDENQFVRRIIGLPVSSIPAYVQNGFKIPYEAYFQPQDRGAFSPLPSNVMSAEGLFTIAVLFRLIRDRPEDFKALAVKYLDSCARIVEAVEDSCHTHWLTALNNQHIAAGVAHRIGLLDDGSYLKIIEHYRHVFDSMYEKALIGEGLQVFVQGAKAVREFLPGGGIQAAVNAKALMPQ